MQGALTRRPSTADSPSRLPQLRGRPGLPPSLTRPASAASESSASHLSPGVSPCGALVAKAVREANREGTGLVWQPLASRQLDSWAHLSGPAHALSAPAPRVLAPKVGDACQRMGAAFTVWACMRYTFMMYVCGHYHIL